MRVWVDGRLGYVRILWTYRDRASDTAAYSTCATVNVRRYNQSNQLMIRLSDRVATRVPHPELWQAICTSPSGGIFRNEEDLRFFGFGLFSRECECGL